MDGVAGKAGETAPSFALRSGSLLDSTESLTPGPLQKICNCLKNDIEDLSSTIAFGGNNRCSCNSSDNGKVKLIPPFQVDVAGLKKLKAAARSQLNLQESHALAGRVPTSSRTSVGKQRQYLR